MGFIRRLGDANISKLTNDENLQRYTLLKADDFSRIGVAGKVVVLQDGDIFNL